MVDVNRDATNTAKERAQRRFLIKFLIDDVTNRAGACELEDEGIDPGDVIWQKKETAFGQMLEADGVDAIKESDERPAKKMERALTGGHVRHRFLFTISLRPSICQSASGNGNERPSCPRRPNRARAAPCDQSL